MEVFSPMEATIEIYCPPMKINKAGRGLRRTAAEPMIAKITLPDDRFISIEDVVIPPTWVHRIYPLYWIVDDCVGSAVADNGDRIDVCLPAEVTVFRLSVLSMVALAITAPVNLVLAGKETWQGSVVFPDCKIDLSTMTAEAITAKGILSLVENT